MCKGNVAKGIVAMLGAMQGVMFGLAVGILASSLVFIGGPQLVQYIPLADSSAEIFMLTGCFAPIGISAVLGGLFGGLLGDERDKQNRRNLG